MLTISEYVRATSLEEAYELVQKKNCEVIGGMLWLKMQNRNLTKAVDLSDLGLDQIVETEEQFEIGAMVSLRSLETSECLNQYTGGAIKEALSHIVGVQFRNCATLGGSIFGKYGFSDVATMFVALGAKVELVGQGLIPLDEFLMQDYRKDILIRLIVEKKTAKFAYESVRKTKTDFPLLTCAVALEGNEYVCSIGARPMRAQVIKGNYNFDCVDSFAKEIQTKITCASNVNASKEYREQLAYVLAKRAMEAVLCK